MSSSLVDQDRRHRAFLLLGIGFALVVLWQTTLGSFILYPLTILATWFHEMGHGIAAMATGSSFERLLIFPNGSGVAQLMTPNNESRFQIAVVAASGPMGPAVAGALLIIASRNRARQALSVLGATLILSTLIWVRSWTGWIVLPGLGLAILALAYRGTPSQQRLGTQILGVQACISAWKQFGYLFTAGGSIGGQMHRSDTGAIADALLLPYWLWGTLISLGIAALMFWSLKVALRP
ncbi:M50 family metallopeptidase [Glacieibacterium frigidum]|uniref:M50 family metallopeptidase n=1 Tax=Glacieibacterium frigidum TaxID=2593303 RepID=A0A552UEY0_9SPHN|nr:M50 family metallopeptidase [Glacieibacterium frigidum]TRW16729.1 M50 family metallopeptidase [Glacieibacterium frigidum]